VKIKRESVNFINKEGSSRNSTARESMQLLKQDSLTHGAMKELRLSINGGMQSVLSSRQNPLTSKSIEDKSELKEQSRAKNRNSKLV
jgi:hypothetical protein